MPTTSAKRNSKQKETGAKLLLIGGILALAGALLVIPLDGGTPEGIGVALMSLASVPALAGLGLFLAGIVEKRSREDKPFA